MKLPLTILTILCLVIPGYNYSYTVVPGNENPCLECHGDLLRQNFKHAPVEKGCGNCHKVTGKVHPGNEKGFELSEKTPQLCIACHDVVSNKKMGQKRKYLHAALEFGGCKTCHLPHSSEFPKLLKAAFPAGNYSPAIKDSFELCFQCHDSDLLEKEFTTTATSFRNGNQNLHYKHTHGNKGRNCIDCHDVHGSDNAHLIADKVPFGKWEIPIIYKSSENGGVCNTGCHAERSYLR